MKDDSYYFHQTPEELAKKLIDIVPIQPNENILEPFKGEGAFYNNFPNSVNKSFCEIEEGIDYKQHNNNIDWVISNPPFRLSNGNIRTNAFFSILYYFSGVVNKGIAFLCNDYCLSSLTPKRLKLLNENGLYIKQIVVCSVKKWRGRYFFVIFEKQPNNFFRYIEGNF